METVLKLLPNIQQTSVTNKARRPKSNAKVSTVIVNCDSDTICDADSTSGQSVEENSSETDFLYMGNKFAVLAL